MSAVVVYLVGAFVTFLVYGAWQRAVMGGPAFAERREHERRCPRCKPPNFMYAHGEEWCKPGPVGSGPYWYSLSPSALMWATLFWPMAPVGYVARIAQGRLVRRFASRVERDYQIQRDREEVERLVGEL